MPDDPLFVLTDQVIAVRGIVERLAMQIPELRQSLARQETRLTTMESQMGLMQQTLAAIKDLLERPNGH